MRPRIPFTSRPASSVAYRFANLTPRRSRPPRYLAWSSSWIATRRAFRSTTPSRSASSPPRRRGDPRVELGGVRGVLLRERRAPTGRSRPRTASRSPLAEIPLVDEEERLTTRLTARHSAPPRHVDPSRRPRTCPSAAATASCTRSPRDERLAARGARARSLTGPLDVDRAGADADPVDALGGPDAIPPSTAPAPSPSRPRPSRDDLHAATMPQLGERRGRVDRRSELLAAEDRERDVARRRDPLDDRAHEHAVGRARSPRRGRVSQTTTFAIIES